MDDRTRTTLFASWQQLASSLSFDSAAIEDTYQNLQELYSQPHRAYHNFDHIADCLAKLNISGSKPKPELQLAIWYHDAIYDPLSKTNEEDSASLLRTHANKLGLGAELVERTCKLILITKHHDRAIQPDEQLLADIDRSILAAEPDRYAKYARQIRHEYAAIDDATYRAGRCAFLRDQLDQPRLFFTGWAASSGFESRARKNLRYELGGLETDTYSA